MQEKKSSLDIMMLFSSSREGTDELIINLVIKMTCYNSKDFCYNKYKRQHFKKHTQDNLFLQSVVHNHHLQEK